MAGSTPTADSARPEDELARYVNGRLELATGVTVIDQVANPVGLREPEQSVGLHVEYRGGETADELAVSEGTVNPQTAHALRKLQEAMAMAPIGSTARTGRYPPIIS
ncbi:MAG: hypothetical protein ACRCYU_21525 [Nocardioides sp.]